MKIKGLKKVAGDSKGLSSYYSGEYLEVFFDKNTCEVWDKYQYSLGQNTWTVYDDPDIIKICNLSCPVTMWELERIIYDKLEQEEI